MDCKQSLPGQWHYWEPPTAVYMGPLRMKFAEFCVLCRDLENSHHQQQRRTCHAPSEAQARSGNYFRILVLRHALYVLDLSAHFFRIWALTFWHVCVVYLLGGSRYSTFTAVFPFVVAGLFQRHIFFRFCSYRSCRTQEVHGDDITGRRLHVR